MADFDLRQLPREIIACCSESVAREESILPLGDVAGRMRVGAPDDLTDGAQFDLEAKLRFVFDRLVELVWLPRAALREAIDWHYADGLIEGCGAPVAWRFRCPRTWEKLSVTEDAAIRFCHECHRPVYLCNSDEQLVEHARQGHCVARCFSGIEMIGDVAIVEEPPPEKPDENDDD